MTTLTSAAYYADDTRFAALAARLALPPGPALGTQADLLVGEPAWWAEDAARDGVPTFLTTAAELRPQVLVWRGPRGLVAPRWDDYLTAREEQVVAAMGNGYDFDVFDTSEGQRFLLIAVRKFTDEEGIVFPTFKAARGRTPDDLVVEVLRENGLLP